MNDSATRTHGRGPSPATVRKSWLWASRIVAARPELSVTWADVYDVPDHVVVHDGSHGAALHFDSDSGPTLETRTDSDVELNWENLRELEHPSRFAAVDWAAHWGEPVEDELTAKAAVYTLIAFLVDADSSHGTRWIARQAKIVHETTESAYAPGSALVLCRRFPTIDPALDWYGAQLGVWAKRASGTGEQAIWHEPLWLVSRDREPWVMLDENGRVHLAGSDGPWAFDLLAALTDIDNDFGRLAEAIRQGSDATRALADGVTGQQAGPASDPRRSWG